MLYSRSLLVIYFTHSRVYVNRNYFEHLQYLVILEVIDIVGLLNFFFFFLHLVRPASFEKRRRVKLESIGIFEKFSCSLSVKF